MQHVLVLPVYFDIVSSFTEFEVVQKKDTLSFISHTELKWEHRWQIYGKLRYFTMLYIANNCNELTHFNTNCCEIELAYVFDPQSVFSWCWFSMFSCRTTIICYSDLLHSALLGIRAKLVKKINTAACTVWCHDLLWCRQCNSRLCVWTPRAVPKKTKTSSY